jgi:hypothetical protein
MRKIIYLFTFSFGILFFACESGENEPKSLVGQWRLSLFSSLEQEQTIQFNSDNTYISEYRKIIHADNDIHPIGYYYGYKEPYPYDHYEEYWTLSGNWAQQGNELIVQIIWVLFLPMG